MKLNKETMDKLVHQADVMADGAKDFRDQIMLFQSTFFGSGDESRLYQIQFPYYFRAVMAEMDRHYPEKGDSYHEATVEDMEKLLDKAYEAYKRCEWDYPRKASQSIDLGAILAMLYQRLCGI